ncbi:uncharacterized protein EV154DRAFT_607559 [Mucor mucedo]|uniref:uncharacterized protein n=1 Tax=Mucor mucedo TaxID=29922 RepID=UPI00221E9335|nr:uncharacterized protein EV154DRAFT_607559 [Mucor mucedo]KAI7870903.1 hypothetical protein EV154DRAFT_607559 [Mucor mucedo]
MSDMNILVTNSVRKIELDVTDIKQMLAALSDQFKNQFSLNITDQDVNMIQKSIVKQSALDRITESVKRSQVIEYPDQLGERTIDTNSEEFEGKKDVPDEQQKPPLVPISQRDLEIKRVQLKSLARRLKHDLTDLEHPDVLQNWKDIPATDIKFYMLHLAKLANDKGFNIYQYSINDAFKDMGRDESPILAEVLSPPPEVANESSLHNVGVIRSPQAKLNLNKATEDAFNASDAINVRRDFASMNNKWISLCDTFRTRRDAANSTGSAPLQNWEFHDLMEQATSRMQLNCSGDFVVGKV